MTEPKLYIIMRRDLWDANPGKMMAQAAHAQADFTDYIIRLSSNKQIDPAILEEWAEDRNFGITLVLHEPLTVMEKIRDNILHADMTTDPTYPYRNHYGEVFVRSEITCMWAFVHKDTEAEYMRQFQLHA